MKRTLVALVTLLTLAACEHGGGEDGGEDGEGGYGMSITGTA